MKITGSDIAMYSMRDAAQKYEKRESLRAWIGDERPDFEGVRRLEPLPEPKSDTVRLSSEAQAARQSQKADDDEIGGEGKETLKILLVETLVEMVTGLKVKIRVPKISNNVDEGADVKAGDRSPSPETPEKAGWGVEYDYHESYSEHEKTSFPVDGIVKTTDGKEIKINIRLVMSREFRMEENVSVRAGDAKKIDPLVINFGGTAAQLTDTKFQFDLDADGKSDSISFVQAGSGFLALDKNNDGVVNNGTELFGPASGDGFSELGAYDDNRDGWIDETDKVYNSLRVWTKDAAGADSLNALSSTGAGAIYLASISTQFDIKNAANAQHGTVASSGIYLRDGGGAGTVQQVDLSV